MDAPRLIVAPPQPDLAGYASVPDYIYGITREIWEDRGVGAKLERYYAADVVVRAPTGVTIGDAGVTADTLATLHQFPDRQLVGEDVIWASTPDAGFLSSHRLISVMTHTGDGALGRADGRPVRSRIIADCWVQDGQVKEEWLVRDGAAFARCLGLTPSDLARAQVQRDIARGRAPAFFTPERDRPSRHTPTVAADPAAAAHVAALERIFARKDLSGVRDLYFAGAAVQAPGGEALHGWTDIDRFLIGYLAALPDATFRVESLVVNRDAEQPVRLAVRWSLTGEHSGFGRFGPPSGAPVHVMGLSHAWVTRGQVRMEWLATDEVAIWAQIHAHTESRAGT